MRLQDIEKFADRHAPAVARAMTDACSKVIAKGVSGILEECIEMQEHIRTLEAMLGGLDGNGRFWVENRGQIIDAITEAGFQIMSDGKRFWLAPKNNANTI